MVPFIWERTAALISAERPWVSSPAGSREEALPDKGWRKQRAEETLASCLWSANNFQPLEVLRRARGRSFFPKCALLCFQLTENTADKDDALGRDFSNWGGGVEGAYIKQ